MTFTVGLVPASAADGTPLTITPAGFSMETFPGLLGVGSMAVKNTSGAPIDDVFVTFSSTLEGSGMTPATADDGGAYYDPACVQPGGAGSDVVCGPYSIDAAGSFGQQLAFRLPSDFLLTHGQTPFSLKATVSAPSLEFVSEPTAPTVVKVRSDIYLQTAVKVVAAGAAPADRPTLADRQFETFSPADKELHWIVTQGGWSSIRDIRGTLTLPAELELREVPEGCTASGSTVSCTWPLAPSGTFKTFVLPVRVAAGLPAQTQIAIPEPQVSVTSDHEPAGRPASWTAEVAGGQYSVVVTPSVDLAIVHPVVDSVVPGTTVSLPFTFTNKSSVEDAQGTVAEISLDGQDFGTVTTTLPGCSVEGAALSCDLGTLAHDTSVTGTVDFALHDTAEGAFTVSGLITSSTPEQDESDNAVGVTYLVEVEDPTDPTGPVDPTDPTGPVDPTGPTEPVDPIAPVSPAGPVPAGGAASSAVTAAAPSHVLASTGVTLTAAVVVLLLALLAGGSALLARRATHLG